MKKISLLLTLFFSVTLSVLHAQSNNEIDDILNREINMSDYDKPQGNMMHLTFIINDKGKAFDYKFLDPIDKKLQDKLLHIFSKVKWEPAAVDFRKTISIKMGNNKFYVKQDAQQIKILKHQRFRPNKFVRINDTLYAATYEVTNAEYKEFLMSLSDSLRLKYRVDSVRWRTAFPFSYHESLVQMYHIHPAYNNFPVVNISLEAARKYCEWLTETRKPKSGFIFRLPTEAEWMLIAHANPATGLPYPNGNGISQEGVYRENLRWLNKDSTKYEYHGSIYTQRDTSFVIDGGLYTVRVDAYVPNDFGLFNIIGNAGELLDNGEVKGGSWFDLIAESTVDKRQAHSAPDPRVGFRVVAEIRKK